MGQSIRPIYNRPTNRRNAGALREKPAKQFQGFREVGIARCSTGSFPGRTLLTLLVVEACVLRARESRPVRTVKGSERVHLPAL